MKWPPAVVEYRNGLAQLAHELWTAEFLLDAFWDAVLLMDGRGFSKMHRSMSSGRMHSETGLMAHSQHLGLIQKKAGPSGCADHGAELRLGKGQSVFMDVALHGRADAVGLVQLWIDEARVGLAGHELHTDCPAADQLEQLGDAILRVASRVRRLECGGAGPLSWHGRRRSAQLGPEEIRASKHAAGYLPKHFTRAVLMASDDVHWH